MPSVSRHGALRVAPKRGVPKRGSVGQQTPVLMELEVMNLCGECMLTLKVPESMFGRDLWKMILENVPSKPGLQLIVSFNASKLLLNESLQQQGLWGERLQVSAVYMPTNLPSAWHFAHGLNVVDEEFSLNGITTVIGVTNDKTPALLKNLPNSIHTLTFHRRFNQKIHHVRWPAGLQSVDFGEAFDQSLDGVRWPSGLQSLTLGHHFNQSLDNVTWPAGLQSLTLGSCFNQSLDNVTWPAGLQSLTFGDFNQSLGNVTWPAGLQSLTLGRMFCQNLDNARWPEGLQDLKFRDGCNQSLDNVTWPASLQRLGLGVCFNQSLDNVAWPAGLQSLTFGNRFNQSLDNVTWPAGLQSLTFGDDFTQSLDNVTWPAGLQSLTLGLHFNQSLGKVTWPTGLQSLTLEGVFDQSLDNVTWPAGLQSLTFGAGFNQSLNNVAWPEGLHDLTFGYSFDQDLAHVTWPTGIQALTFLAIFSDKLVNAAWPADLQSLAFFRIRHRGGLDLNPHDMLPRTALPTSLRTLLVEEMLLMCWKWMSRWWFQRFFIFTPKIGEDFLFDEHIFQMGWFNHQLVLLCEGRNVFCSTERPGGKMWAKRRHSAARPYRIAALHRIHRIIPRKTWELKGTEPNATPWKYGP